MWVRRLARFALLAATAPPQTARFRALPAGTARADPHTSLLALQAPIAQRLPLSSRARLVITASLIRQRLQIVLLVGPFVCAVRALRLCLTE